MTYEHSIVTRDKHIRSLCNMHHEFDHTAVGPGFSLCQADAGHTAVSMLLGVQGVVHMAVLG